MTAPQSSAGFGEGVGSCGGEAEQIGADGPKGQKGKKQRRPGGGREEGRDQRSLGQIEGEAFLLSVMANVMAVYFHSCMHAIIL